MFDVSKRTIFLTKHGSHAYGLNVSTSDLDVKGICIPPKSYYLGCCNVFEQSEEMASKNGSLDSVVYALAKFCKLAMDANPNIIEVLHVDDSDILKCDKYGEMLREARDLFISKKARFTFAGYAHAQLKRIKTHRSWLLSKPEMPKRSDFGLDEEVKVSTSELGAYDSLVADNVMLPKNVVTLFTRERAFQSAKTHHDQYLNWVKTRNPARSELEAKYGYDTKHGMHLIRLMMMCQEILVTGKVNVRRDDREYLLSIRRGEMSYDELIETAENIEKRCEDLYNSSPLPREADRKSIDKLVVNMTEAYLSAHG